MTLAAFSIRRAPPDTPLARRAERATTGAKRRPRSIPWADFERQRYTEPALALACEAQRALAAGEYGAVHLFSRLASAVSLHGVPMDLVLATSGVAADEARHANCALRMAELLAGGPVEVRLDPGRIPRNDWRPMTLEQIDACMVEIAAIGETLAAALLSACRDVARDPVARRLFETLVADEVHHARVGWYYLAWRAPQWSRAERQRAADRAGAMVAGAEVQFWRGRDAPSGSRTAARALGVLDSATQRKVVRRIMEDEIVPALDALGLGASHAWRVRRRGRS